MFRNRFQLKLTLTLTVQSYINICVLVKNRKMSTVCPLLKLKIKKYNLNCKERKNIKKFINKILNVPKLVLRLWILLWVILILLLIMKFSFNIWYPIIVENKNLLKFNEYVCNSWVKYLITGIFYLLNANLLYLISCIKKKYNNLLEFLTINLLSISAFIFKIWFRNYAFIFEILISVIIPIIYLLKTYKHINIISSNYSINSVCMAIKFLFSKRNKF